MKKWIAIGFFLFHLKALLFAGGDLEKLEKRIKMISSTTMGWCSEEKSLSFLDLVLETKPKLCVEIGVFGGASLVPVICALKFLKAGIVIGIDPWDVSECIRHLDMLEDKEHIEWWSKLKMRDIYYNFIDKLILYDLEEHCKLILKTSQEAAFDITSPIDILHIDGHRSEKVTMQDVKIYFPKVSPGGYIWLGDASSFYKQSAIDYLLERCDVVRVIDHGNCILFRKR